MNPILQPKFFGFEVGVRRSRKGGFGELCDGLFAVLGRVAISEQILNMLLGAERCLPAFSIVFGRLCVKFGSACLSQLFHMRPFYRERIKQLHLECLFLSLCVSLERFTPSTCLYMSPRDAMCRFTNV